MFILISSLLKAQFVCSGVKYMIDIHLMSCEDPSPLVIGDDFVMLNQKNISMMSAATYFHSEVADIQYVGTVSVWVVSPATHYTAFGGERITGPCYHTCTTFTQVPGATSSTFLKQSQEGSLAQM